MKAIDCFSTSGRKLGFMENVSQREFRACLWAFIFIIYYVLLSH